MSWTENDVNKMLEDVLSDLGKSLTLLKDSEVTLDKVFCCEYKDELFTVSSLFDDVYKKILWSYRDRLNNKRPKRQKVEIPKPTPEFLKRYEDYCKDNQEQMWKWLSDVTSHPGIEVICPFVSHGQKYEDAHFYAYWLNSLGVGVNYYLYKTDFFINVDIHSARKALKDK